MRILALSDIHARLTTLKKILKKERGNYDLIIVSGDFSSYSGGRYDEVIKVLSESSNLVVGVPGNVDPPEIIEEARKHGNVVILHKEVRELGSAFSNYLAVGVGGGTAFSFWDIPVLTDEDLRDFIAELEGRYSEELKKSSLILITHTPPFNTKLDVLYSGEHVGSRNIREFVLKYKPLLHVCGHVHESRGIDYLGTTLAVNPGPAMAGNYAIIESEGRVFKATLRSV